MQPWRRALGIMLLAWCGLAGLHCPALAERLRGQVMLQPGLNLVGLPVEHAQVPDVASLLMLLGPAETITKVLHLNPDTGFFETCAYDSEGNPVGSACAAAVTPGEGWLVVAAAPVTYAYDVNIVCPSLTLRPGLNLVAVPCAVQGLTAMTFLQALGDATVVAGVQVLDAASGRWRTVTYHDQALLGQAFPMLPGQAYLLHVRQEASLAPPVAEAGRAQIAALMLQAAVELDGRGSHDADTDPAALTFQWQLQPPDGSAAVLTETQRPTTSFVADVPGLYTGTLTVTDGVSRTTDTVTIVAVQSAQGVDTDGDGLSDAAEPLVGTDPHVSDTDGDGLPDGLEVHSLGTDPRTRDTDGDGFEEAAELNSGADPVDAAVTPENVVPPDPAAMAPLLDRTVATDFMTATAFLYVGDTPIQHGVAPGTMAPRRAGVLRGKVLSRDGAPLAGVTVSIVDHAEFGHTVTRADGMFDLAVNGGGLLTVHYARHGFLSAQRTIRVPWREFVYLPDVALVQLDAAVTAVELGPAAPAQVVPGRVVTDDAGTRQGLLLIPAGTTAELVFADGSTRPLEQLQLHITEFTVGPNGPAAMPADLPPTSAYTYAVAFTAEEELLFGTNQTRFAQPIYHYVENYLGFATGEVVPVGSYDPERQAWVPEANGRVIEIVSVSDGLADLDVDGTGLPAEAETLAALGVSDDERTALATRYAPGQSLWRVPIAHLGLPFDYNWPYECLRDDEGNLTCVRPDGSAQPSVPVTEPCRATGFSTIACQNQTLGETIGLVGSPLTLHYQSDRVPGRTDAYNIDVALAGDTLPPNLIAIDLTVEVAGQRLTQRLSPAANLVQTVEWDGRDVYGRQVQGRVEATVSIAYAYQAVYTSAGSFGAVFGQFGGSGITGVRALQQIILSQQFRARVLGLWDQTATGLGGWSLSVHQTYDPGTNVLYLGDGRRRDAYLIAPVVDTVAGMATGLFGGFSGDGGPATEAEMAFPAGVAAAPDGSYYIAEGHHVRRVDADGVITSVLDVSFVRDVALGPDGSVYALAPFGGSSNARVLRLAPDGTQTFVAGIASSFGGFAGDGGPATEAALNSSQALTVGPDGSLYIADTNNGRVREVSPDGIIETIVGTGPTQVPPPEDGTRAHEARLYAPVDVAVGPDGSLYIADSGHRRVFQVRPDGTIHTVAGDGGQGVSGVGGPAAAASVQPVGVAVASDGTVYIANQGFSFNGIYKVTPAGLLLVVAGVPEFPTDGFSGDKGPAPAAHFNRPGHIGLLPDGTLLVPDSQNHRVRHIFPALPVFDASGYLIAAENGRQVFGFDAVGRHLRTIDALTGVDLWTFGYDSAGRLSMATDTFGNVTRIERDAAGQPMAIVAPGGQRTTLELDAFGQVNGITNPAGEIQQFNFTPLGLLVRRQDPRGNEYLYTYDDTGRLTRAEDPAGGFLSFERQGNALDYTVTKTSALGRVTTYRVQKLDTGDELRTHTFPDGTVMTATRTPEEVTTIGLPDGSQAVVALGPDPRFGMAASFVQRLEMRTPSGLTALIAQTRTVELAAPHDLLSLTTLTDIFTVNGRVSTRIYDASTRTMTLTTAAGRQQTLVLDPQSRPVQVQTGNLAPVTFDYDALGRPVLVRLGSDTEARTYTFTWSADNHLRRITDSLHRATDFDYDAAGRLTRETLPDTGELDYDYDENANLITVTPPGRPAHTFAYTAVNQPRQYNPPDVGLAVDLTEYTYDADRQLTHVQQPDGDIVEVTYDAAGRREQVTAPHGQTTATYDATTGLVHSLATSEGLTLTYTYDGPLLTSETWTGPLEGAVTYTYDQDSRVAEERINGTEEVLYTYDSDGLLVQAGALTASRQASTGLLTETELGMVRDVWTYNAFGEPLTYEVLVDDSPVFRTVYTWDVGGRVVERHETLDGVTTTTQYGYDAAGRLLEVTTDGVLTERYVYDANGNRLAATTPAGTVTGTYDAQDRLAQYRNTTYAYTANGDLLSTTDAEDTTTYDYDTLGNLRGVGLPDGSVMTYVIDARGRRVGKQVNGVLVQQLLYRGSLQPVAELDGSGNVVARFVYGTRINVPDYMVKADTVYRIISDLRGSPRLVIDTDTGQIVQRLDYEAWGRIVGDTNAGFQPFGFAGGLYDPDTKLTRFGARDYDAVTGRWTTKDPWLFTTKEVNLYSYALVDPINFVDVTGNVSWKDWVLIAQFIHSLFNPEVKPVEREPTKIQKPADPKPGPGVGAGKGGGGDDDDDDDSCGFLYDEKGEFDPECILKLIRDAPTIPIPAGGICLAPVVIPLEFVRDLECTLQPSPTVCPSSEFLQ